ncbi:MAG: hypothetical protein ABIB97_05845 [Patescibacteria group bacterium]
MTKPIQIIIGVIIILAVGVIAYFLVVDNSGNENTNVATNKTYPEAGDHLYYLPDFLITDNQDGKLQSGQYNTDGLVVDTTYCPPCPVQAVCMPCPEDAILVAETISAPADKQLRISADNPDQFVIEKKYIFSMSYNAESKEFSLLGYSDF